MKDANQAVQIRIPVAVHQALKNEAQRQERSINWLVNKVLADAATKLQHEAKQ